LTENFNIVRIDEMKFPFNVDDLDVAI